MEHKELTAQLRRMSVETGSLMCLGCGYEHNCGIHGCALLRQAVDMSTTAVSMAVHCFGRLWRPSRDRPLLLRI